jgi:hypothetical protein
VGASFRFFASNGTVSPLPLNNLLKKSGKFNKACNQTEELGSLIINVSSCTLQTPQSTGAGNSPLVM